MADYLPGALPKFTDWVALQTRKRADHVSTFGWDAAEVQRRNAADAAVLQLVADAADALTNSAAAVRRRDEGIEQYQAAARRDVARDKTHPAYTASIGKDLDWLTPEKNPRLEKPLKATLKVAPSAEGLRLDWSKQGQDGVKIFRRPAGTPAWTYLAFDSRSPYIDTETGLTGPYEYYAQLLHNDVPVGEPSDIIRALHGSR